MFFYRSLLLTAGARIHTAELAAVVEDTQVHRSLWCQCVGCQVHVKVIGVLVCDTICNSKYKGRRGEEGVQ